MIKLRNIILLAIIIFISTQIISMEIDLQNFGPQNPTPPLKSTKSNSIAVPKGKLPPGLAIKITKALQIAGNQENLSKLLKILHKTKETFNLDSENNFIAATSQEILFLRKNPKELESDEKFTNGAVFDQFVEENFE